MWLNFFLMNISNRSFINETIFKKHVINSRRLFDGIFFCCYRNDNVLFVAWWSMNLYIDSCISHILDWILMLYSWSMQYFLCSYESVSLFFFPFGTCTNRLHRMFLSTWWFLVIELSFEDWTWRACAAADSQAWRLIAYEHHLAFFSLLAFQI